MAPLALFVHPYLVTRQNCTEAFKGRRKPAGKNLLTTLRNDLSDERHERSHGQNDDQDPDEIQRDAVGHHGPQGNAA